MTEATVTISPGPDVVSTTNTSSTTIVRNGDGTTTVTNPDGTTNTYTNFGSDSKQLVSSTETPASESNTSPTDTTGSSSGSSNDSNGSTGGSNGTGGDGGSTGANNNNNSSGTGNAVTAPPAATIQAEPATQPIPNPLHQFASYTYAWSLWLVGIADYNNIFANATDVGPGLSTPMGPTSYVVAEDSGLYPNRRLAGSLGLNYQIQKVEFDTVIGLMTTNKSTNLTDGKVTILEPYGVTFIDTLIKNSFNSNQYVNWTQQPFMLQLDFTGYDDAGNPIPTSQTAIYRKRFPIILTEVKVDVTTKGAEYVLSFSPTFSQPHLPGINQDTTPKNFTVTAGTVAEFFDPNKPTSFTSQLNKFYQDSVNHGDRQYASVYTFEFDPTIAQTQIVYSKQLNILQANPQSDGSIDLTKSGFSIPAGTKITEVINKVMTQSGYLQNQLGVNQQGLTEAQTATNQQAQQNLTGPFKTFKTVARTRYSGADASGNLQDGVYDNIKHEYAKSYYFGVHQYTVQNNVHPATSFLNDTRPNTVKVYNYIYTGKNIDIVDLKINFDTTWYLPVATYTNQKPSTNVSSSTGVDTALAGAPVVVLTPQFLAATAIPQFGSILNPTPLRIAATVNNAQNNVGFGIINNPGSQVAADVLSSLYSRPGGDMLELELTIVGDPSLIKQDDWLYTPSPVNTGSDYNNTNLNQFDFYQKWGSIRMDKGQLVATVTINTPIDNDTDWTGTGLVFPNPGSVTSLFSGQYLINTIKNTFENGKFLQVLSMTRHIHDAYTSASKSSSDSSRSDSVSTSQGNGNGTNATVVPNSNSSNSTAKSEVAPAAGLGAGETIVNYSRD